MMPRREAIETFRVFLMDAFPLRRAGLTQLLLNCNEKEVFAFEVVEGRSLENAVEPSTPFDLAIFSGGGDAAGTPETLGAIASLTEHMQGAPVVVLSDRETAADVAAALRAGARGYIAICMDPCVMLRALRFIIGGGVVFPPQALLDDRPAPMSGVALHDIRDAGAARGGHARGSTLTSRESDVLQLLRQGESNKLIGIHLQLRESTIKVHIRTIMRKLGASNRTQAALRSRDSEITGMAIADAGKTSMGAVPAFLTDRLQPAA